MDEQFKQSDITFWGITALICGAFAVFSANISTQIGYEPLAWLHSTRLESGSLSQVRLDIARLTRETQRLQRDTISMRTQVALAEETGGNVNRRVGALEVSIPALIEALPYSADIDRSVLTSAISPRSGEILEADGGSIVISQRPLALGGPGDMSRPADQSMPPSLDAGLPLVQGLGAYGLAIGPAVTRARARDAWNDLTLKVGALLIGLEPRLADQVEGNTQRLLAGPFIELSDANRLCDQLSKVSVECTPMPFAGLPL